MVQIPQGLVCFQKIAERLVWEEVSNKGALNMYQGWDVSQGPSHSAIGRGKERRELRDPYRGIFPCVVGENPAPTGMLVCPMSNIVDLAIDHKPLVCLLIMLLDLLPTILVEAFSGHDTLTICLLLYTDLNLSICCLSICYLSIGCLRLLIQVGLLTQVQWILFCQDSTDSMRIFKLHA